MNSFVFGLAVFLFAFVVLFGLILFVRRYRCGGHFWPFNYTYFGGTWHPPDTGRLWRHVQFRRCRKCGKLEICTTFYRRRFLSTFDEWFQEKVWLPYSGRTK